MTNATDNKQPDPPRSSRAEVFNSGSRARARLYTLLGSPKARIGFVIVMIIRAGSCFCAAGRPG